MKNKLICLFTLFFISIPLYAQQDQFTYDELTYGRAEIVSIEKVFPYPENKSVIETHVHLNVIDGKLEGHTKTAVYGGEGDLPVGMEYSVGDVVFIGVSDSGFADDYEYISIYDTDNTKAIIILCILLIAVVIAVGRFKGVAALTALAVTVSLIFLILIPATIKGYHPLPITILLAFVSITITLPIIAGFSLKTLAAIIGAAIGVFLAAMLAMASGMIMHLSGIVTNEMLTVFYVSSLPIDMRGLALSGMIIAALGAIMDVCISIASSANEIYNANPEISEKKAFKSVLTIGSDILGTMVNTLILAYVGSSLSLILFIGITLDPDMPLWMILNYNPVLSEIVKSVVGTVGMFLSIPATAFVAIKLMSKYKGAPGKARIIKE